MHYVEDGFSRKVDKSDICMHRNSKSLGDEWRGSRKSLISEGYRHSDRLSPCLIILCQEEFIALLTFYLLIIYFIFFAWWQSRKPEHWKIFSKHSIEPLDKLLMHIFVLVGTRPKALKVILLYDFGSHKALGRCKVFRLTIYDQKKQEAIVWIPKGMHLEENAKLIW